VHRAEDRPAAANQGNIYGELTVAVDELFGAVERVDQPVLGPGGADGEIDLRRLLRQQRDGWCQLRQRIPDDPVARQVGLGQRRLVFFLRYFEILSVNLEDRMPGGVACPAATAMSETAAASEASSWSLIFDFLPQKVPGDVQGGDGAALRAVFAGR
jgi:hypothetical protein